MSLKPIIKTTKSRSKVSDWLVGLFPEGYQSMSYLDVFLGDGSVLLAKEASNEEVVSDPDPLLMNIWRALRDEYKTFVKKVKGKSHAKTNFERILKAHPHGDYMEEATYEFILRHMSKGSDKKTYLSQKKNGLKCGDCWCGVLDRIPTVFSRIERVYMPSVSSIELLKAFDHEKCIIFCDPPIIEEQNSKMHSEIGNAFKNFRGKVILLGKNCPMYKRMYSEWNRKPIPEFKGESVWMNF